MIFEAADAKYKWMSDPFAFRKTQDIAERVCKYFESPKPDCINGSEEWLKEKDSVFLSGDLVLWYHYVAVFAVPYIGVFWGFTPVR